MSDKSTIRRVLIVGPQGSGKGTQMEKLSEHLGVPGLGMGQLLRDVSKEETELGRYLKQQLTEGTLTPEHMTNGILRDRLSRDDTKSGFVLEGFPRNDVQEAAFREMVATIHGGILPTHVIALELSDEEAIERLSKRRSCSKCWDVYHVDRHPPKKEGVCDECGGTLIQREDDTPEATKLRLSIYHTKTEPLLVRYEQEGIVHRIDACGSIDEVFQRILSVVEK